MNFYQSVFGLTVQLIRLSHSNFTIDGTSVQKQFSTDRYHIYTGKASVGTTITISRAKYMYNTSEQLYRDLSISVSGVSTWGKNSGGPLNFIMPSKDILVTVE